MSALGDFLERRWHEMGLSSRRKFAELCKVSHSTMNDIVNGKADPHNLKIKTLLQISSGSGVRYETLAALCAPESQHKTRVEMIEITEDLNALPEERLRLARGLIKGLLLEERNSVHQQKKGSHTKALNNKT